MDQLDDTIHQPVRLRIVAALKALPKGEQIEFVRLKEIVRTTEGNLGAHVAVLEKAGYVEISKDFAAKRPRTRIAITAVGRRAFTLYVDQLKRIIDGNE
ncbi:DNA-binding MarR family transcriptional regulator [Paraburkholderia sp. GAS41]|jgi:DNA-binding MarR family transcriptional regulator|uniref:transcriptional regulator n=1 Tax=Paraburkholderia sp. GAS41 TaxID=3035134 RepID=UPI003D220210